MTIDLSGTDIALIALVVIGGLGPRGRRGNAMTPVGSTVDGAAWLLGIQAHTASKSTGD